MDNNWFIAVNTAAELCGGLISAQHTILAWTRTPPASFDGWARASKGLWTRDD